MCQKPQLIWRIFAYFNWKNELFSRFSLIAENRAWFCHITANIQKNKAKESASDINETFVTLLLIFWQILGSWFDSNLEILAITVNFRKILKSKFSSYLLNNSRISSDKASKLWKFFRSGHVIKSQKVWWPVLMSILVSYSNKVVELHMVTSNAQKTPVFDS